MIDRIISFSIKNKFIVGLFTAGIVGLGLWSMSKVPLDAVPDITNNQVQVITQAPNLGTVDIEQFITYPVELAMANLPGVVEIRSISRFGLSVVTIVFKDEMKTYLPRQLVSEKLGEARAEIPKGFGEPFMGPITTGLGEIYQYTLEVDSLRREQYSAMDLRTIQDWIIRRQMAMVPGVVEVNAYGGSVKQYEVAINPDELRAIGLTIADVFDALEQNNQNTGGAYIEKNHLANFIRGEGLARSVSDIEQIVVKTINSIPIRIRDVASVGFGSAIRYGAFTKDGNGEAVGGMILMLKGANSNVVIQDVKERMAQIQESLPEGVTIKPFLDRSELIRATTNTVKTNLIEGGLIVVFILVILLGNWRGGLIVASTIPLSLLFAFIMMHIFGVSANLMSLGAIDFGIIVDGAVIIVEAVVFLIHDKVFKESSINAVRRDSITFEASTKMMNPAFFGQLIILIVFIPILFLEGIEGKMFKPMALVFGFAMAGSMVLCLTYVPMISSVFLRAPQKKKFTWPDRFVFWIENKYEFLLTNVLRRGAIVIGSAVFLFILSIFTFSSIGGEFIPQLDEGDIAFHIIMKPGSSLTEAVETSSNIESILLDNFPEVKSAQTRFGVADLPTDPMPMDLGDCFVTLKPKDEWVSAASKKELIEKMKEKISVLPGVNIEFTQPIEMRFNELITGVREDVAVKLFGEDLQLLASKAEEVGALISGVDGIGDMRVEATTGLPQMTIKYNRHDLAQYGINIRDVNTTVESAFAGGIAGVIFEGEKKFDLVVRLDSAHRTDIDNVRNLYIHTSAGVQIPLKEVAEISYQPGPMQISRDNTQRRVSIGINVRDRDIASLVAEIKDILDENLDLPAGYYIRYGGAFENFERAFDRLKVVVPVTLVIIFILIFFALRSFGQTMMIYMAIPLAAIGGIFSLWIRDMPFSISAGVGFIVLFGVAVMNGLILINGLNELKEEGIANVDERIRKGARRRIRPIMLTMLTDVFGFLPMAISVSAGAEVQRPLATVVIGGLVISTLLTLFVLPILYRWTETSNFRPSFGKAGIMLIIVLFLSGASNYSAAQQPDTLPVISLDDAISRAKQSFPSLMASQLEVKKQKAQKATSYDLGNTEVFTGGEEIGGDEALGIYTVAGVRQQDINIFSIVPSIRLNRSRVGLSEAALNLTEIELELQVKRAYAELSGFRQKMEIYLQLDSAFRDFQRIADLKYEVEETSKLAWLASVNQAKRVTIRKEQAVHDYRASLQRFNYWLSSDTIFTVDDAGSHLEKPAIDEKPEGRHPEIRLAEQQVQVAEAIVQKTSSGFYPSLSFEYGLQKVGGKAGFVQFEAGITLPLAFWKLTGVRKSAVIDRDIAVKQLQQTGQKLLADYRSILEEYNKWRASWLFYQDEALPATEEQRKGAIIAYREGAIDYLAFIQIINETIQTEVDARDARTNFLKAKFELEYYLQ